MPVTIIDVPAWGSAQAPGSSDLCTDLSVKDAVQSLANRDAFLNAQKPSLLGTEYLASTPGLVFPDGCRYVLAIGCGGGGGGGGGKTGSTVDNVYAPGGGGGGGAELGTAGFVVVPGRTYNVVIGGGGTPGALESPGQAGGDTYVLDTVTNLVVAVFRGAQGGNGSNLFAASVNFFTANMGGEPVDPGGSQNWVGWGTGRSFNFDITAVPFASSIFGFPLRAGQGGYSRAGAAGSSGQAAARSSGTTGFTTAAGGAGGTLGGSIGAKRGGAGGGGGGGGAFGPGGPGGNGGIGGGASPGDPGATPAAPAANTGGGGGGGGGGGAGAAGGGAGAAGVTGASGRLFLVYGVKE